MDDKKADIIALPTINVPNLPPYIGMRKYLIVLMDEVLDKLKVPGWCHKTILNDIQLVRDNIAIEGDYVDIMEAYGEFVHAMSKHLISLY